MTSRTQDFLRAILPEEGLKVAAVIRPGNKAPHQTFWGTFQELETILLREDALGATAYHACASFKNPDSRKAENALGAKSFWADIDAGPGKPYQDAATAAHAVLEFVQRASLPRPIFVGSGLGLHVYWPVDHLLDVPTWLAHASGLKALCHNLGLHADPIRTADIASVLRTPGTHWRKQEPPRIVEYDELQGPYPLSAFRPLLDVAAPVKRLPSKASSMLAFNAKVGMVYPHDPVFTDDIAAGCEQLRILRDTRGAVQEPMWHAMAGVLAFAEDGEQKALEWSSGGFEDAIRDKFARARTMQGPTGCGFIQGLNPPVCQRCPLYQHITTPLQVGRMRPPAPATRSAPVAAATDEPPDDIWPEEDLPFLPKGYHWEERKRLIHLDEETAGHPNRTLISEHPIYLAGIQTGEAAGNRFGYVFKQFLPHRGWIDIVLGAGKAMGQNGVAEMFDQGANIHDRDLFRRYVQHAIDTWHAREGASVKFDQFGWKESETAFLWGKRLFSPRGDEPATGSDEINLRAQWLGKRAGGSLQQWSQAANIFFAKGNEPQAVALLAGFAAPLMRFHATDEGGAVLSLVSTKSGTGKTTALGAAASVWGRMEGLSLTNIDTRVAKAITLGVLGNLPVIYDELANRDPEVVKEFVMVFTNGRDKMRGTIEGGIRHTATSWQTLLLAASNLSIVDLIQSTGGVDAPALRVLELNVEVPDGRQALQGDKLRIALDRNAGHAGDAYIRYLVQPPVLGYVRNALPAITDDIWKRTKLDVQHRFWVRTIGSLAVAAQIVHKLGLVEFSPQRIIDWTIEQVTAVKDDAPTTSTKETAISSLSEYLAEHFSNTLVVKGSFRPRELQVPLVKPVQRLLVRYEIENQRLLVAEKPFRDWLTRKGYGARQTIRDLSDKGVVINPRRHATLSAGTEFAGGQMPCVEINAGHPSLSGVLVPLEVLQKTSAAGMALASR